MVNVFLNSFHSQLEIDHNHILEIIITIQLGYAILIRNYKRKILKEIKNKK